MANKAYIDIINHPISIANVGYYVSRIKTRRVIDTVLRNIAKEIAKLSDMNKPLTETTNICHEKLKDTDYFVIVIGGDKQLAGVAGGKYIDLPEIGNSLYFSFIIADKEKGTGPIVAGQLIKNCKWFGNTPFGLFAFSQNKAVETMIRACSPLKYTFYSSALHYEHAELSYKYLTQYIAGMFNLQIDVKGKLIDKYVDIKPSIDFKPIKYLREFPHDGTLLINVIPREIQDYINGDYLYKNRLFGFFIETLMED